MAFDYKKPIRVEHSSIRLLQEQSLPIARSGALVEALFEERTVVMELVSPPSAIGICKLRYEGREVHRHINRLRVLTDEARTICERGSGVIVRRAADVAAALESARVDQFSTTPPADFTVAQIDALFDYVKMRHSENRISTIQARRDLRTSLLVEKTRLEALLKFVRDWRSEARRRASAMEAGLSAKDYNDPNVLIARLYKAIVRARAECLDRHPDDPPLLTFEENRLLSVCHNYLTKHSDAGPMPD